MNAKELYDILQELAADEPSTANLRQLHEVIKLCAAEGCRSQGGTFGNLFSQIDFVCKHFGLKAQQKWAIQQARRHSNGRETLSLDEWHYDLRAVTLLISTIFHEDVPGELLQLLPVNLQPQPTQLNINKRYIRCIVRSYNDKTITADSEEGEIVIDYGNTDGGRDFAYLQKILREGMQLNLLDCHYDEKIVPGLIVVEPDFMLDISSLAACFTASLYCL